MKKINYFDLEGFLRELLEEKSIIFLKEEYSEQSFCINALEIQYNSQIKKILRGFSCKKFNDEAENEKSNSKKKDFNETNDKFNKLEVPSFARSDEIFSFENQVHVKYIYYIYVYLYNFFKNKFVSLI